jgi:uncharacterized protein (DUF2267 family)
MWLVDKRRMTVPAQFDRASKDFYRFLVDARDEADVQTTHRAYTMVEGVLLAFRRRLSTKDALRFANALPLLLRAMFVADWDPDHPIAPWASREVLTKEVQSLRANHNFAPDDAIVAVAKALRRDVGEDELDAVLGELPEGAREFWAVE